MSRDMGFWLLESDREVKVALSITVTADPERAIIIERWIIKNLGGRTHPTPFSDQKIQLIPRPGRAPKITGYLKVAFHDIFLRPRRAGERNLVFEGPDLERMAGRIWAAMDS